MKNLIREYGVNITTICADYFLHKKLFRENQDELKENIVVLKTLIKQANKLNIRAKY